MTEREVEACLATCDRLRMDGRFEEAEAAYKRALAGATVIWGEASPQTTAILNNIGIVRQALGDLPDAHHYYLAALEAAERGNCVNEKQVAAIYQNLAVLENTRQRFSLAEAYAQHALEIHEKEHAIHSNVTAQVIVMLADSLRGQDRCEEAKQLYERALPDLSETHREHCREAINQLKGTR